MFASPRVEELRRRVHLNPASIAFAALAEEYRRSGRLDEAIATCTAGLARHPAYFSARVTLGRSLLAAGRIDEARREIEGVLALAPENLAAVRALDEIHQARSGISASEPGSRERTPQQVQIASLSAFLARIELARRSARVAR